MKPSDEIYFNEEEVDDMVRDAVSRTFKITAVVFSVLGALFGIVGFIFFTRL